MKNYTDQQLIARAWRATCRYARARDAQAPQDRLAMLNIKDRQAWAAALCRTKLAKATP